jgi:hypothetical protein
MLLAISRAEVPSGYSLTFLSGKVILIISFIFEGAKIGKVPSLIKV